MQNEGTIFHGFRAMGKKRAKASDSGGNGPRVRNLGIRKVRVSDILPNPRNYRTHDKFQRDAFAGAVEEIGWFGYPDVYTDPETGQLMLVDGELRKEHLEAAYGPDAEIEVNVTDFDPVEASVALATKDPLAQLAGTAGDKLEDLLTEIGPTNDQLNQLFDVLADQAFEANLAQMSEEGQRDDASDGDGDGKGEPDPDLVGKDYRTLTALLTDEQHDTVIEAVNQAKEQYRLDTTAEALAVICRDWMGKKGR